MQADGAAYMARDKKVQQEVHFFICLKIFMGQTGLALLGSSL